MAVAVAVALSLVLFSGCASNSDPSEDPQQAMEDAKSVTQQAESAAIGYLPTADVREINQISEGTFLQCDDGYQWSGNIRATLRDGVRVSAAQRAIAGAAEERGADVHEDESLSGGDRFAIDTDEGVRLLVTVWDAGTVIDIDSASPFFRLPASFERPRTF